MTRGRGATETRRGGQHAEKKRRARPSTPSTGSPGLCPGQTGQAGSGTRVGSNKDSAFALTLCSLLFACGILDSLI